VAPRRLLLAAAAAACVVALFAFMHSGARAGSICAEHGLASAVPAFSWWPPGARCIGGTDEGDVVELNPAFLIALPALYFAVFLLDRLARRTRQRVQSG
jgi:hypothetical protein